MEKRVRKGAGSSRVSPRSRLTEFVSWASKKYNLPMDTVETIASAFVNYSLESINENEHPPIYLNEPGIEIPILSGLTLIYGGPDVGKSSLLCGICRAVERAYIVAYLDSEGKLSREQLQVISLRPHIVYAKDYITSGLREVSMRGILDIIFIDSVTAIYGVSQHPFLRRLKGVVPYIICSAQTRTDIVKGKQVPALFPESFSLAQTVVRLTERERVSVEGVELGRVYYTVEKSSDTMYTGRKGSFIIHNGVYDPFYTAYDILKNHGVIRSIGSIKYLTREDGSEITLGKITKLSREEQSMIIDHYYNTRRTTHENRM